MLDKRVQTYERYLAAWLAIPDANRLQLLDASLSEKIVFANPQQTRHGISEILEHLQGFQRRSPGGSFRTNTMVGWGTDALAEWQLVDATGAARFSGYDVLHFDDQDLIETILLFGNVEAQKLAWRKRDPVSLEPTE